MFLPGLAAATAALHRQKAVVLALLTPPAIMDADDLPPALLQETAADHSAAYAACAAASAGRPRLTPAELAALLARGCADAAAQVSLLGAAEAEAGLTEEVCNDKVQRFAYDFAAQQPADVLDVQMCIMSDEKQWAIVLAQHPHLVPK